MNENRQPEAISSKASAGGKKRPKHAKPEAFESDFGAESDSSDVSDVSSALPEPTSVPVASSVGVSRGQSKLRSFASYIVMLVVVFAVFFFVRTFVFIPYDIPSGSMEDTIMPGDMVFSEKISYYLHKPAQGDIITFADPLVAGRTLIKRVIATDGQTVDFLDGKVVIDGVVQDEPYTFGKATLPFEQTAPSVQIAYPYTVPEGHLWVMGDNRPFSQDSRYFGAVSTGSVTGRAAMIYWPFSDFRIF